MHKRGQVTVFLAIAAIILILVILLNAKQPSPITQQSADNAGAVAALNQYVETCIHDIAEKGLYQLAIHGGYLYPSGREKYNEPGDGAHFQNYYYSENIKHPFVLVGNTNQLRPKIEIEEVLSNYIAVELPACINDFSPFRKQGFSVEAEPLGLDAAGKVKTIIGKESTTLSLDLPVTISKEGTLVSVDSFQATTNLRFGLLYDLTSSLLNQIATNQPFQMSKFCSKHLFNVPLVNVYVESNPYTYEYLIRVADAQPVARDQLPFKFQYAVKNLELYGECVG